LFFVTLLFHSFTKSASSCCMRGFCPVSRETCLSYAWPFVPWKFYPLAFNIVSFCFLVISKTVLQYSCDSVSRETYIFLLCLFCFSLLSYSLSLLLYARSLYSVVCAAFRDCSILTSWLSTISVPSCLLNSNALFCELPSQGSV